MVRTMIPKTDYAPCAKVGENIYRLMFHREDVEQDVLQDNDEGKQVPTGEKEATDYCNVNLEMLYYKPSPDFIVGLLKSVGIVDLGEATTIISNFTEEPLSYLLTLLLHNIDTYDTSVAVNSFMLQGKEMWLPKETRVGLVNSVTIEKNAGKETTVLWFGGERYELSVDTALQMLSALELYALECYNVTAAHKAAVNALESVEDVVAYDYTQGYPEKLNF